MTFVDPNSERGMELIREVEGIHPSTQGDPPPEESKRGFWRKVGGGIGELLGTFLRSKNFGGGR